MMVGLAALVTGCREADQPVGPGANSRVEVSSDPAGGSIILDGSPTGKVTPDLLRDLSGLHEILVRLDRDGVTYGYRTQVDFKGDSLIKIAGPLTMRCTTTECAITSNKYRDLGRLRVATNPNGALFYYDGGSRGLLYPTGFPDGYVSIGMPVIGALSGTNMRDTLGMGPYDLTYLAGRPAPSLTTLADKVSMTQTTWILPPTGVIVTGAPTIRGIQVDEELIGLSATNDVAYVKLTFTNITNNASYQATDPIVPAAGLKYDSVYIGFAVDPDIGDHQDDVITYAPSLDMVYAYDFDFRDALLTNPDKPAIVGLRLLSTSGAARILNGWLATGDYKAGDVTERFGWGYLSGKKPQAPDYPGLQIGTTPINPGDYRMSVSSGPYTLAPGASASITVAVIVADPVQGLYTPGNGVLAGDPLDNNRTITKIAKTLLDKAASLVIP